MAQTKNSNTMKKVLYVILAILVIYLVLCLIGPSDVRVERTGVINAPAADVQATLSDFNTFQKWSPWREKDTNMKVTVEGTPGQPGHKYSWEGNKNVGKGTMTLDGINGDTVNQTLDMGYGAARVYMVTKEENGATNFTWGFYSKTPFFFRPMGLFMNMDKMLGGDFEKGIVKLKALVESAPKERMANYEVQEMEWPEKTYVATKKTHVTMDKIPGFFGENIMKLMEEVQKNKVEIQGGPAGLYWGWDDVKMEGDMAVGIAVPNGTKMKGWETVVVPAGKVLSVTYYGPDSGIGAAHMAMTNYMKEKNLARGVVIEEYMTDRAVEKDSMKWQTNIYYTLK